MTDRPRTRSETFARAEERGRHLTATILSGPDMLTGEIFAHRLGLTVSDLHDLEQAHAVLVLPESSPREARYPAWQIDATGQPFPVPPALFDTLGDSGWTIYRFLMQSHPELAGQTALEALRDGRVHWSSGLPTALRKEP
ncbi:hypothetical protein AA0472_2129 [Acetobacter estunensis NRIC 0472]|uniref:Uncharacterized protein n=2 Tax=Acetobacteraceae TaxID=433 RepID=A0A967B975_9PROT|nr:hypothetical protein [Acetobacter estunensis]NHO55035.1 hypothetical protein [Acetobacter estunensis]GBQ26494.1 hypothetical protein AA0472_2129 [Acetobacter estunensis NRIC 0472]